MTVWVVRAGQHGEFEQFALNNGVVGILFGLHQNVLEYSDRNSLRSVLEKDTDANQLWRFAHELRVGETLVLPCKQPRVVAVGRITGEYEYKESLEFPHTRSVEWEATDIPRGSFDPDLLYSFGGLGTVFRVNRVEAEARIKSVVERHLGAPTATPAVFRIDEPEGDPIANLEEAIPDRIADRIRQKFTGNRLEYFVESILKAQGYTTKQTRRGADGGIDVVAGRGQMGFDDPRLCVQVKSGTTPVDLPDYNRLQGNISSSGADHGLLVSLSGFTRTVLNENERSFFVIRLWDSSELTQNMLAVYPDLPADIRDDIPLIDMKVLRETEM